MNEYSYIIGAKNKVTIVIDSEIFNISVEKDGKEKYQKVIDMIKAKCSTEELYLVVSIKKQVETFSNGVVTIKDGKVHLKDKCIESTYVGTKLLELHAAGFDCQPLMKFIDNLYQNTSYRSVTLLYKFLEDFNMPITPDGCFLAYKKVGPDFKDLYTGTMDNSVGAIVSMDRNEIDDDPNSLCSAGLHFCAFSYISQYAQDATNSVVVILKINPKDVVSIPTDYDGAKGRCCKYEVVSVNKTLLENNLTEPVMNFTKDTDSSDHEDENYDTSFPYYSEDYNNNDVDY